ncbi:hypothetical protein [Thermus filiformis]|uniref:Replication initiation factor n=1 Tax=Thermus filiformis TaxID=276 RepID=A0A0A2WST7_THEFI|nr:hypothetical protein [Thermus filiformis]KGQ21380.2 hypothetical protein THFILI_00285 [Thermus filiformis]
MSSSTGFRLLGFGIDTLTLNFYWPDGAYRLPEGLPEILDGLREAYLASRSDDDALFWGIDAYLPIPNPSQRFFDSEEYRLFEVAQVHSVRHYRWGLNLGGLVLVRLSDPRKEPVTRSDFPAVRIELTGSYMMYARRRADEVVSWLMEALTNLVGTPPARVQVSRVDLFADVEAPLDYFRLADVERFTSRARSRSAYLTEEAAGLRKEAPAPEEGGLMSNTPPATRLRVPPAWEEAPMTASVHLRGPRWSGFVFGRSPLMARVYSKSVEAATKPVTRALLKAYEDEHGPIAGEVVRVEFQLGTEALGEMLVDGDGVPLKDWTDFRSALSSVWDYLTGSWLVFREAGGAARMRDNAPDAFWLVVQSAFRDNSGAGGKVVRYEWLPRVDVRQLAKQALGSLMTALVAVGARADFSRVWGNIFEVLGFDWKEGRDAYADARLRKHARFGLLTPEMQFGGVA